MLDLGATTFWEDFNLEWLKNAPRIDEIPVAGKIDVHKNYGGYCYTDYRHSFAMVDHQDQQFGEVSIFL